MPEKKGRGTNHVGPVGWREGSYRSLTAAEALIHRDGEEPTNGMTYGLNLAGAFTVTLPSVAEAGVGWRCRFRVETAPVGANYVITEDASADTNVLVGGPTERDHTAAAAAPYSGGLTQVNFIDGVAVVGDYIDIECNGVNFFVTGLVNADGAVTLT